MDTEVAATDGSSRQRAFLLPSLLVLFVGTAALAAWFLIGPTLGGTRYYKVGYNRTAYEYSREVALLFVPYGLALWAWRRGARVPLWLLLAGAGLLHVAVLFAPLPQSQDFYQYLFYGKMQVVHHANPFVVNPSDFWADGWFPWIRWNTQPSVYGPAWILLSAGVVKVAGSSLASAFVGLKLVIFALDAAVVAAIVALAKDRPRSEGGRGWGVLAYAWNPLVLIAVPLAGSADVAVAAAFLGAVLARRRGKTALATLLLSLAALVKAYALIGLAIHLALLVKERGGRRALGHAGSALGLAALAYAPYWAGFATFKGLITASRLTNQSLAGTVQRTVVTWVLHVSGFHYWYTGAMVLTRVIGAAVVVAALVWAVRRVRDDRTLWYGTLVVMTAYLLVSPWFLYWYLLAPLALVIALPRSRFTDPMLTFSGTSLISIFIPVAPVLWGVQTVLRYGPPAGVLVLQSRAARRPAETAERPRIASRPVVPAPAGAAMAGRAPAAK